VPEVTRGIKNNCNYILTLTINFPWGQLSNHKKIGLIGSTREGWLHLGFWNHSQGLGITPKVLELLPGFWSASRILELFPGFWSKM